MEKDKKIILLIDVFEHKKQKQKELEFYLEKKEKLEFKLTLIRRDIELTNHIIKLIEKEKVEEIKK